MSVERLYCGVQASKREAYERLTPYSISQKLKKWVYKDKIPNIFPNPKNSCYFDNLNQISGVEFKNNIILQLKSKALIGYEE